LGWAEKERVRVRAVGHFRLPRREVVLRDTQGGDQAQERPPPPPPRRHVATNRTIHYKSSEENQIEDVAENPF